MNKLPKAIIFDWDNTLIDTFPVIHKAINSAMAGMNKEPWSFEKVKRDINKSMRESFPEIFGKDWQKAGKMYQKSYHENNLTNLQMLPDSLNLLKKISNLGITMFVVSNKLGPTLRQESEHLGIKNMFFSLTGAHDAKEDKPSKYPVELTLEGSDIDPKKDLVWFIGDSYVDVECALNSDCYPMFFNESDNHLPKDLLRRVEEETGSSLLSFKKHQEIITYLEKIS
jgi:phosphoglycolate phosphatase